MFTKEDIIRNTHIKEEFESVSAPKDELGLLEVCVEKIKSNGIDITNGYTNWLKAGFALASLGQKGRGYFHDISRNHPSYNQSECDKQFNHCLKKNDGRTDLSTFFHLCKEHGITYKNDEVVHNLSLQKMDTNTPLGTVNAENTPQKVWTDDVQTRRVMRVSSATERLERGEKLPDMIPIFGTLWQTGEVTIFAADTGTGKTLIAVQLADKITKGADSYLEQKVAYNGKVLLYDFELTDRNFHKRYGNYTFSNDLLFADYNPSYIGDDNFNIHQIKNDVIKYDCKVVIIDNISALSLRSTVEADESLKIMKELKKLQLELDVSVLVLAHTPKIPNKTPISINHLAGSKNLSNFCDSVFFLSRSVVNENYRYIIQKKSRNADEMKDCVIIEKVWDDDMIGFNFLHYDIEKNHLNPDRSPEEELELVRGLHEQGMSYRDIGSHLSMSKSKVGNIIKKIK